MTALCEPSSPLEPLGTSRLVQPGHGEHRFRRTLGHREQIAILATNDDDLATSVLGERKDAKTLAYERLLQLQQDPVQRIRCACMTGAGSDPK